jgi:hypothetical protein
MNATIIPDAIMICIGTLRGARRQVKESYLPIVETIEDEKHNEECEALQIGLEHGIALFEKMLFEVGMEKQDAD